MVVLDYGLSLASTVWRGVDGIHSIAGQGLEEVEVLRCGTGQGVGVGCGKLVPDRIVHRREHGTGAAVTSC